MKQRSTLASTVPTEITPKRPHRPLLKLLPTLLLALFFMIGGYGQATGQNVTVAEDDADNYDPPAWNTSNNQGTGFEAWSFDTATPNGGFAGRFIGSFSTALDTNGKSFELFANSGNDATSGATRPFPKSLEDGDTFTVSVGVNFRDGAKGFDLRDASDNTVINFNVENDEYILEGTTLFSNTYDANTVITFTFTQNASDVSWIADRSGGRTDTQSGTISSVSAGTIDNIRLYNVSAGTNDDGGSGQRNLYFNSLEMTSPFDLPPETNASNISFSGTTETSMDVNWTSGDGDGRIVVAREGNPVSFIPANGTAYTANADYSAGAEVGPTSEGNKVVYNAAANTFTLSGLQPETTYHFAIYEYNDNGGTATQTAYLTVDTPVADNTTTADFIGTTGGGTLWSDTATWVGGIVPGAGNNVELSHAVTLDQDATISSLIINTGGGELNFDANNRTLNIEAGGELNNQGTFSSNNGTVAFAGTGSITGTVALNNLNVSGAVNPGSTATINGTLSILSGGSITNNTPAYGASSTLRYNTLATVNPGAEWPTGATANPVNVTLEGTNTQVSFGSDTSSRTIGGNLIIGDGSTLQLSSAIGGDLRIIGDWTNQGAFDSSNRAVFFVGASEQTVTNAQAGGIEIDFLINDNMSEGLNLIFNSDLTVQELTNNTILDLNSNNLTVKAGGSVTNNFFLYMSNSTIRFEGAGVYNNSGSSFLDLANLEIGGGVFINFDTTLTITNRLVINEGGYLAQTSGGDGIVSEDNIPDYGAGATLVYTGTFGVNDAASGWGTSGNKIPDNVAVEGSGNLTLNASRSVSGEMNVGETATLNVNSNLTIESGAFLLNDGTVNGAVNFQQLVTNPGTAQENPNNRWASFSAPVSNAVYSEGDVNSPSNEDRALLRKVWTQGFPGANDPRISEDTSVLLFDTGSGNYVRPTGNDISPGEGFFAFLFESKDRDDDTGNSNVDFTAPFATQGTINPNAFSYTDLLGEGFNLLGNPLGIPVDWAATEGAWTKTNLNEWIWLWDAANNQFVLRSDTDPALGSAVIAPFQAYFISANPSPALELTAAARTTSSNPNAGLFDAPERPFITLELEAGETSSKTHIRFGEDYSEAFSGRDAVFLSPMASSFAYTYSLKQNQATMLNSLPLDLQEPLEFSIAAGAFVENAFYDGPASFSWPTFEHMPEEWTITLQDTHTGAVIDLREADKYEFMMSAGLQNTSHIESFMELQEDGSPVMSPEFTGERFILTIEPDGTTTSTPVDGELPTEITLQQNYPNPFNPATQIAYALPEASEVRLEVFNVQGQHVATLIDGRQNAGTHSISFDAGNLSSGVYLYRLRAGNQVITRKMTLLK